MRTGPQGPTVGDLHLCNNYRHLFMALASIAAGGRAATVLYLDDDLPLDPDLRRRLALACPLAEILVTNDRAQTEAFARLPRIFPALLRRNLSFGGRFGLLRPRNWQPVPLTGRRFAKGYLYHSGFFLSKVVAGRCDRVILRESGLNNYITLRVPLFKALFRLATGLPPFQQVWGEEAWVHEIEVSQPEALPSRLQAKARKLTLQSLMTALPQDTAQRIAAAFLDDGLRFDPPDRSALVLTQPLARIGLCSPDAQNAIYRDIISRLHRSGYHVYVKPHPLDQTAAFSGVVQMPRTFPAEAISFVTHRKFSLAVALCSASLAEETSEFADRTLQLVTAETFNAEGVPQWQRAIDKALGSLL